MRIAQGTITKPAGKVFETKYGEKQMLIVTLDNGAEEKFYQSPGISTTRAERGTPVVVTYEQRDGKQVRRLSLQENNNDYPQRNQSPSSPTKFRTPNSEPAVIDGTDWAENEAENVIALMNIVSKQAIDGGFPELPVEEIRNIAISIYISSQRKFPNKVVQFNVEKEQEPKPDLGHGYDENDIPF